jgi:putative hydrolase
MSISNARIAAMLDEIAERRKLRGDDSFRVAAYRNAAVSLRNLQQPVAAIFAREGIAGLRRLSGIGTSLARRIAEIIRTGRSRLLEQLRRLDAPHLLTTIPSVGPRLAGRIQATLGTDSLEELLRAAQDGRLRRVAGVGQKRVQAIRESLASRLGTPWPPVAAPAAPDDPSVDELLAIDRQYRRQAARGALLRVAPRSFNPAGVAWLPILRTQRNGRRYRAHYTNTARSHELGHIYDWVAVIREDKQSYGQWTIVTATHGPLRGRRVVRGREHECQRYYDRGKAVQKNLPNIDAG